MGARILAVLLIAFVAMGAQCVASCSLEALAQPPCHKSPVKSCAHDQAAGENLKVIKVELVAVSVAAPLAAEPLPIEAVVAAALSPTPPH